MNIADAILLYNSSLHFQQATGTNRSVKGNPAFTFKIGKWGQVYYGSFKFDNFGTREFDVAPQEHWIKVEPVDVSTPLTMKCTVVVH